jgi:Zn-dependent peptidase ImmA (M78 family)
MSGASLSDLELARLQAPGRPDALLVTDLARETLDELSAAPPVSHEIVASMRGIVRIEEAAIPWAGYLARGRAGLVITLRSSDGHGRRRFTAFHEIMHTYLPGFAITPQYRCDPGASHDPALTQVRRLEALCDLGAAELLFPRRAFREDTAGSAPTMPLAEQLARQYEASVEATARRLVSLRGPALLLALEPAHRPRAPYEDPKLRVQWVHLSGDWPFVPRHKSVPSESVLAQPLVGDHVEETATLTGLTAAPIRDVRVSAGLYPYADGDGTQHTRILALITPAGPARRCRAA